jgi:glycosyltransferase involved in cell wall biosynthesis
MATRRELNLPLNGCIVVSTCRLHWVKGWKLMLEAFQEFLKVRPDSHFYFLGDGDSRADIELFVKAEKLEDRVNLPGFQTEERLAKYLNAADLFVLGSFPAGEGWSTSLLEAKGCCVPICVTKFSSSKDIVHNGIDGYVVENRIPAEFAASMLEAVSLTIDPVSQERVMRQYSASEIKNDLFKIWGLETSRDHKDKKLKTA